MTTAVLDISPRKPVGGVPHSSTAPDEDALAVELVHVVHSWISDISPPPFDGRGHGVVYLR